MTPGDDSADRPEQGRSAPPRADAGPDAPRLNGHRPKLTDSPVSPTAEPAASLGTDSTAGSSGEARARPKPGSDSGGGPDDPDEPIWKKHQPPFYYQPRVILAFLILLLFVGAIAINARRDKWPPPAQCDKPAIAGSVGHAKTGFPIYWALTGRNDTYAVTIGASSVRLVKGAITITGTESQANGHAKVIQQPTALTGCRIIGHLDMPLPSGEYHLRLFRISGGTATQVALARIDSDG